MRKAEHTTRLQLVPQHQQQRGATLLELLVGLTIGLLVIAAATSALLLSRTITNSISDASGLQQQGSHVLRILGQQLRQAGSLLLNVDPLGTATNDVLSAVVFEIKANALDNNSNSFELDDILNGTSSSLTTGFRRYPDAVYAASDATSVNYGSDYLARNCIGLPGNTSKDQRIESTFTRDSDKDSLHCTGNGNTQPIAQNVAELQFTYLIQDDSSAGDAIRHINTVPSTDWPNVRGVQVCFVLYGSDIVDMPTGSSYTDCSGNEIDIKTLSGKRQNRMHMVFRNIFQVRSQGLPTI